MDFLEKLDFLMKRDKYNKNSFSKASGIPYTTIDGWYKRGYDELRLPTVKKLCSFFNTSLDFWLKEDVTDPDYGKTSGFEVNIKEMEYIKKYRFIEEHSPEGASIIDSILNREYNVASQIQELENRIKSLEVSEEFTPTRIISYYQRLASAGKGEFLFGDIPTDTIEVPLNDISLQADFVIGINGRSMETTYYDGEKVFVKKTPDVNYGEIGLFIANGDCYIKELGHNELISHNKDKDSYPNIKPDENGITIIGKVLGKVG